MVLVPAVAVGAVGVPVSAGDANGAFRARSEVKPVTSACATAADEDNTPDASVLTYPAVERGVVTVPVNVGDASGALRSSAVCAAVETGLSASEVLSTLLKPTSAFTSPEGDVIVLLVRV